MSNKRKKQANKEVYERCISTYKYDSDYDPRNEVCFDTALDKILFYGTMYPKHDKNDYSKNTRGYEKTDEEKNDIQ